MKIKTTRSEIKNQGFNLAIGYGKADAILALFEPTLYHTGVYGWNADYYPIEYNIGVVTGYRTDGMASIKIEDLAERASEQLEKINRMAKEAIDDQDRESVKIDFMQFILAVKHGEYDREYFIKYRGEIWGRGWSKKKAINDFLKDRYLLSVRMDHTPTMRQVVISHD